MDVHGLFYELPPLLYSGKLWGVKPISSHLRIVPDFCYWRGLFVMAGDQTDNAVGQPQSGLWFGNIDELWQMGKPQGWGGPWWKSKVQAGVVSDPFLMTGFDKKVLHLSHDSSETVDFTLEVDFLGDGSWVEYKVITVLADRGYEFNVFPVGFSAHWIRIRVSHESTVSAYFVYS
jgi:hypothetical protein